MTGHVWKHTQAAAITAVSFRGTVTPAARGGRDGLQEGGEVASTLATGTMTTLCNGSSPVTAAKSVYFWQKHKRQISGWGFEDTTPDPGGQPL